MGDLNSVVSSLDFIERTLIRSGGIAEENMARDISRAKDVLRQLERERDAAVKRLKDFSCSTCKYEEVAVNAEPCQTCFNSEKWEFDDVQEAE